jgi:glyoxylase-like metal-dependent hydrolase (beta-lactamase superfamily II)
MDASIVKEHFPHVRVYVHSKDRESLVHPDSTFYLKPKAVIPDVVLEGNETIFVGKIEIQVIYTPGHTEGSVCYYLSQEKLLFSGDTLFRGTIGRINGSESMMWESLQKLSHLPPDTRVIPGHSKDTTIGEEAFLSNPKKFFS